MKALCRMFFTTLIWFRSLYKISNSCWFCIHFWKEWELWKTFDAKMIGWTHFRQNWFACTFLKLYIYKQGWFKTQKLLIAPSSKYRSLIGSQARASLQRIIVYQSLQLVNILSDRIVFMWSTFVEKKQNKIISTFGINTISKSWSTTFNTFGIATTKFGKIYLLPFISNGFHWFYNENI